MANLYFYYGAMGSSKTANALMVRYNYESVGKKCLMAKPRMENRDGERVVKSRIGLSWDECVFVDEIMEVLGDNGNFGGKNWFEGLECIIVDEAQFLKEKEVKGLCRIVDEFGVSVMCYGLRADFRGELFEGSKWLLALADSIREVKTVCHCGRKAIMNCRWKWVEVKKEVVREGEQVELGGDERYVGLCRKCWSEGRVE